jgi:hypothetical protein
MTAEELEKLIRTGKGIELAEAIAPLDELQRKALSKKAAELHKWARGNQPSFSAQRAAGLALLGLCGWTEAKKWRSPLWAHMSDPATERVLRDRRPDWLEKWVQQELMAGRFSEWLAIRRFVRDGLCPRPTTDSYILGMLRTVYWLGDRESSMADKLRLDRGLLDDEVWQIFEADFADQNVFFPGEFDGKQQNGWGPSLVELCNSGELDRARLLTSSLDALNRRQQAANASWFLKLHEALAPTLAERIDRQTKYADLLVNTIPSVVGFAIDALKQIAGAGQLDATKIVDGLSGALTLRQKGHAMNAVRLLKACAKQQVGSASIARAAAMGLDHPATEVQNACVEMLEQIGVAGAEDLIAARMEGVAPSLRDRAGKLLGTQAATAVAEQVNTDEESTIAKAESIDSRWRAAAGIDAVLAVLREGGDLLPVTCDAMSVPRLDPADVISPITTIDELIERFSQSIEKLDSAIDLELLMDGMSRLVDRPVDFAERTAPLLHRAVTLLGTNSNVVTFGTDPETRVRSLAKAWIERQDMQWDPKSREKHAKMMESYGQDPQMIRRGITDFLGARVAQVALMVRKGIAGPLLALPTHAGGWIDPRELVRRVAQRPAAVPRLDLLQALLRLAPDHRDEALQNAATLAGEAGAAIRYALGGDEKIGTIPAIWIAAARARSPLENIPALTEAFGNDLGPDAAVAASLRWRFDEKSDRWETSSTLRISSDPAPPAQMVAVDLPTVLRHEFKITFWAMSSIAQIRSQAAVWPANQEAFFAQGALSLASRLNNPASTLSPTAQYFEPLFDQDTPLGPMAQLALCLGMLSKDASARGMAIDALIAVITDGRCTGDELGSTLAAMKEASTIVRLNRIAEALSEISRVGPLQQYVSAKTVEAFLAALHTRHAEPPGDLHHLLTPLREWLTALGCGPSHQAQEYLQQLKVGGKTKALIQTIMSMPPRQYAPKPAILQALQSRIERAARWISRVSD